MVDTEKFVPSDGTFAGHGLKSLTVEVTPQGMTYLYVLAGETRVLLTLTPLESDILTAALSTRDRTTEITRY